MLKSWSAALPKIIIAFLLLVISFLAAGQDNSPYSRYGLGDLSPQTNITSRGIGSISAAYSDFVSINFNNPASYAGFQAFVQQRTKEVSSGRVVLDVGMNFDNRTLIAPNTPNRFRSADAMFSYLQVGLPLKKNWGLSFGIRPVTRVGYLINRQEYLKDPVTGDTIENSITQFKGSGGSYLPTIGTGFGFVLGSRETKLVKNTSTLSLGVNAGYLFGSRQNTTLRSLLNDSVLYYSSNHSATSSFGDLYFDGGMQFQVEHTNIPSQKTTIFRFGISGNLEHTLNARVDTLRETFTRGSNGEPFQIDSVYQRDDTPGEIKYPASYKAGFVLQRINGNRSGWLFGADYTAGKWSNYRFFGKADSVGNNWMVNVGGQFNPRPRTNYFSNVVYRFGAFTGRDYIRVGNQLPVFGVSFGMGLPIRNYNRLSLNQATFVNLAFEYTKRGNNDNLLKENLFRLSVGFNFTDLWFGKRRYD